VEPEVCDSSETFIHFPKDGIFRSRAVRVVHLSHMLPVDEGFCTVRAEPAPWCRLHIEKLIVISLVILFHAFNRTHRFHWCVS
jgi:hypothetical protein